MKHKKPKSKTIKVKNRYGKQSQRKNKLELLQGSFLLKPFYLIVLVNLVSFALLSLIGIGIIKAIENSSPKYYGDYCNSTSECYESYNLICIDNRCICPITHFASSFLCEEKFSMNARCSSNNQCKESLYCFYDPIDKNNYCKCNKNRYWNSTTNRCELKISYNLYGCLDSSECVTDTNLICSNNKCICPSSYFWNGIKCEKLGSYLDYCRYYKSCDYNKLLNCTLTGPNPYLCQCPSNYYWNDTFCTNQLLHNVSCSGLNDCRKDLGLYCDLKHTNTCICNDNSFWNKTISICSLKNGYGKYCLTNNECMDDIGLVCLTNICQCQTNYFYNGVNCLKSFSYGLSCNGPYSGSCDTTKNLICDSTTNKCICNSSNTYYWDYNICTSKLTNGSYCYNTIQCRSDLFLYCYSTIGQCVCPSTMFWKTGTNTCANKGTILSNCGVYDYECQDFNGLTCQSSQCKCKTNFYWDNVKNYCVQQLNFYLPCVPSYSYYPYEQCSSTQLLTCQSGVCKCTNFQNYWNSVKCVSKLPYNNLCQYQISPNNDQCRDYSPLLVSCMPILFTINSWKCGCKFNSYYGGSNNCIPRLGINQMSCTSNGNCLDFLGLICVLNKCQCPTTQYFDSITNICKLKIDYGQKCLGNYMCKDYANMFCYSSVCGCSSNYYYNSTYDSCLPRSSHDQYCGDTPCLPYRSLTCSLAAGYTCQCVNYQNPGSSVYWSLNNQTCVNCPTAYTSGYGYGNQNSINSITTRCYKFENTLTVTNAITAIDNCNISSAHLTPIRNTMEYALIDSQILSTNKYLLDGSVNLSTLKLEWNNYIPATILTSLWIPIVPIEPNEESNTNDCIVIDKVGNNYYERYGFFDYVSLNSVNFICETAG